MEEWVGMDGHIGRFLALEGEMREGVAVAVVRDNIPLSLLLCHERVGCVLGSWI